MATVETGHRTPPDAPERVGVAADGSRVTYLRAGELWVYDVGGASRRASDPAHQRIREYAADASARAAVYALDGQLNRADLLTGQTRPVSTAGPASDPRLDPTGDRIGYLSSGGLHIIDPAGRDALLAGEPDPARGGHPYVSWGRPEPAARHFGRTRGWWWAPDGRSVLAARVDEARRRPAVSLHLLDLDGGWVDVHWDRETYPYLVSVCWCDHGDPLIAVLRQPQQHGLVLAVDARTGETQVHAELADPRWVEPVPGTPCHLSDGRVLVGGELAHDGYDARCLFADGTLLTPPSLYVRRVVGRLPGTTEILVEGSAGEPSEQHLFRVSTSVGAAGIDARRITTTPGWHRAVAGGDTLVIGSESLDHPGLRWTVYRGDAQAGTLSASSASSGPSVPSVPSVPSGSSGPSGRTRPAAIAPPARPADRTEAQLSPSPAQPTLPQLARVTDRRLPTGVLYPRTHVSGRRLPLLVDARGLAQGVRAVQADWSARQDWADAGLAVVVVDHRGTPGVAPSFEKVVHRRLADLALADLADALAALTGKHPDLDLDRVAIRGRGLGGWLAALAVLRRPELFRCAVAEVPVVDWAGQDPVFAERYLGPPEDAAEIYQHHSLLAAAGQATDGDRPLLLLPETDNGPARQLAAALAAAGHRPPVLVPPAPPGELRRAQFDFLRRHLSGGSSAAT